MTSPPTPQPPLPTTTSTSSRLERRGLRREEKRNEQVLSSVLDRLTEHHAPTYEHCRRVASLSRQLAIRLHMSPLDVRAAFAAGLLHDVGHVFTPVELLEHRGPLSPDQWAELHCHTTHGHALLAGAVFDLRVLACARDHHERPNGTGYPNGLHLRESITALVAVADHVDTMRHAWCRRRGGTLQRTMADIRRLAGRQLDVAMCHAMHELFGEPWESAPSKRTGTFDLLGLVPVADG